MRPRSRRFVYVLEKKGEFGKCSCSGRVLYFSDSGVKCESCGKLYGIQRQKNNYPDFGNGTLILKTAETDKEISDSLQVRSQVFIMEQKISKYIEVDGKDKQAEHVVAYLGRTPVGCARVRYEEGKVKIERLAVLKDCRRHGIGGEVLDYAINSGKEKNPKEIFLHAQYDSVGFYEKHGFATRGGKFWEAGIPHIKMFLKNL